jgi:hypothetical protein
MKLSATRTYLDVKNMSQTQNIYASLGKQDIIQSLMSFTVPTLAI